MLHRIAHRRCRPVEDQAALRPLPAPPAPLRRDGTDGLAPLRLRPRRNGAPARVLKGGKNQLACILAIDLRRQHVSLTWWPGSDFLTTQFT